ncbi:MAG TPA: M14 family zinc carboxypeptidase [Pyrinomonadaceae bacterium]|nr:M14 family zinc carboxypeptidase [Pyrinomonadaceae bacterium]
MFLQASRRALTSALVFLLASTARPGAGAQTPRQVPAPPSRQSAHAMRATVPPSRPAAQSSRSVPAPEDVLGFRPGDDRKLASWQQMVDYFRRLDAASERVRFEELGKTTLGAPFVLLTISAPENLARLREFRDIQSRLADPRRLGPDADRESRRLIARGRNVVLITCGVHSTEVGSTLSSALIAHRLASSDDADVQKILRETIVLLVPSLNPDGVDIVKRWYDRTLGTPHEGTSPPELYHKYVGHDNNRDWYAFTQVETQLTVDKVHNVWRPQIVHDIHQMGAGSARLFLPPYMKPVEPNVPAQVVEGYTELGRHVAARMGAQGFRGIVTDAIYDAWTPARAYSHYHGGARILSETASARLATPVQTKFESLRASSDENYDPKKPSPNFPDVWPGGEWTLRDITRYMTTAAHELLLHAADNRERWLRRFYEVGREAVRPRRRGELQGFRVLPSENSADLAKILQRAGVELESAGGDARARARRRATEGGTIFVRMAQPYGGFAKALLEAQSYPDLRDKDGNPIQPYDVTAHTLPLLMGVRVEPVYEPVRKGTPVRVETARHSGPRRFPERPRPRVGLYKSHVPSMDEGWTRWVFEGRGTGHASLDDREIRAGNLRARYDSIVIPDHSPRAIFEGHRKGSMPDEFTGGLGEEGVRALREFVEAGGTLVCLNNASNFAIEQLKLPVRNTAAGLRRTEFYVPGSILRVVLDTAHPVARGMPRESVAWVEDSPVFEMVSDPAALQRVKVVARYPQSGNPLLSGWLLGEEKLRGKAALVEVGFGRGRVILFGFRPQYRAQSLATYPLLFNSLAPADAATP